MTIAIISTGGTIASTANSDGASPGLSGEEILAAVPDVTRLTDVTVHDFSNIPSTHFTIKQMGELARFVSDLDVDGAIITQGTDVLEETAYFLDCCYKGSAPVVFTGAMRNPSLPSPDGPRNLLTSVRTALSERARGQVLVALNDRVHAAREVTKMNTMNPDSFRSPEFGPLAVADEARIVWRRGITTSTPDFTPDYDKLTNNVHAVTVSADMPPSQIAAAKESSALCLATTGAGHFPPQIISTIEALPDYLPRVATTRCPEGRLARETYGFPGSETTLKELGFLFSNRNLQKTRIKTIVALASDAIEEAFISA